MADLFENLYDKLDSMGLPLDGVDEDRFYIVPGEGRAIGQILVERTSSGSGVDVRVEFIDYKRQCSQNGLLDKAVQKGITSIEELIEFCDDKASYDGMDYTLFLTRDVMDAAQDLRTLTFQMERDIKELSKKLSERMNEGISRRFCRRFIRNEAEERKFPDKVCLKVKGQVVELTEAAWDSQDIVSILQDMGLSFTRAYGYGFYCADPTCYRFFCQALKRDDKAQKAVEAGKPITKASFIKALDVVAYVMNDALKKGDAHIKIGESRKRRFEDLSVEDDAVEVSLENIIDDSCQEIADSCDVEYQLDSDLTRWTYTIETNSGAKDNRVFSLDVRESGLSGRATAVYDVELEEIVDDDYEAIKDKEFRCTWTGDWEDDMRGLCSDIVNWALYLINKRTKK